MVVRVVADDAGYTLDRPLIAAIAVDLSEALDTREAAAGERVLACSLSSEPVMAS